MKFFYSFKLLYILPLVLLLLSCNKANNQSIKIHRFDKEIMSFPNLGQTQQEDFKDKYKSVIENYINIIYPYDSIDTNSKLDIFVNSNATKLFYPAIDSTFSDLSFLSGQLTGIAKNLRNGFNLQLPEIYTAIIPYNQSIILTDSVLILGLNHYLGENYPPYTDFPKYKRTFKIPERMQYDITESVLKNSFQFQHKENTFLERAIYEGCISLSLKNLIPNYDESIALKYTPMQLDWCKNHETTIWNELISSNILYSSENEYQNIFFKPSPSTQILSTESPGEMGKWIGANIVQDYIDKTNVSLLEILKNRLYQNSQTFLINSKYNGK